MIKDNLDKRISDVIKEATNNQTFREFIRESEKEFGMTEYPLDNEDLTDEELKEYIDFLSYLWDK